MVSSLPTSLLLSSQSLLCTEYPTDDPYILQQFSKIKDNPVLLSLHKTPFTPSNIINYISAIRNRFINSALKDFTVEELRDAEKATNYWMFPTTWTTVIREEIAFREQDLQGLILAPIAAANMERMRRIFPEIQNTEDPFDLIYIFETKGATLVAHNAARHGDLDCLKYAHENGYILDTFTCKFAAMNGHLECLKYAHENGFPWNKQTCEYAAMHGHLECLKYAHENGCPWDRMTCNNAAYMGRIECLKYAHENGCPWNEFTCLYAAMQGRLECLKYAHENGCPWDKWTYINASYYRKSDCLQYAIEKGCPQS